MAFEMARGKDGIRPDIHLRDAVQQPVNQMLHCILRCDAEMNCIKALQPGRPWRQALSVDRTYRPKTAATFM